MNNTDDLSQYWVDEESPYIEADTVAELIKRERADERLETLKEAQRTLYDKQFLELFLGWLVDSIAELQSPTTELGS